MNHPNICVVHDVGREGGVDFIVMEYIEGETLADRLEKGPLPLERALHHGIEIADALDKAHRRGVVHRDLKPGNVIVTKSGVKLLDFGLAKIVNEGGDEPCEASAVTAQKPLTEQGAILGTFQYMAPEQLEGKEVDARTDVFAFGALIYEMVTGGKAFHGSSQASLICAIMTSTPPAPSTLVPLAPPMLDRIVRTCLQKDPDDRWQSLGDVVYLLQAVTEGEARERSHGKPKRARKWKRWIQPRRA